jgi:protein SCO1/2
MSEFDPDHAGGLTGNREDISRLARRYRIAFMPGAEETHSTGVFVFDSSGRARLLVMPGDSDADLLHDLREILK